MRTWLAVLVLALLPTVSAHGAVAVLEVEEHVLDDEATDLTYAWDGFDITDLYIREAYDVTRGDHLIARILASGGPTIGTASEYDFVIEGMADAPFQFTLASADGIDWSGDLEVLEAENVVDESTGAVNVNMQVAIPLRLLNASAETTIRELALFSHADGERVDAAPGGYYAPGLGQELTDPMGSTSSRLIDELALDGPDGYTESAITFVDGRITATVENLIGVTGQHLFMRADVEASAVGGSVDETPFDGAAKSVEAGQDVTFWADFPDVDVITIYIDSDLGGRETFYVRSDGMVSETPLEPLDAPDAEDAPGLPLLGIMAALAIALVRRH